MSEQLQQYFRKRERAERAAAASASPLVAREIHLELANRYAAEIEQCRREAGRYAGNRGDDSRDSSPSWEALCNTGSAPRDLV